MPNGSLSYYTACINEKKQFNNKTCVIFKLKIAFFIQKTTWEKRIGLTSAIVKIYGHTFFQIFIIFCGSHKTEMNMEKIFFPLVVFVADYLNSK